MVCTISSGWASETFSKPFKSFSFEFLNFQQHAALEKKKVISSHGTCKPLKKIQEFLTPLGAILNVPGFHTSNLNFETIIYINFFKSALKRFFKKGNALTEARISPQTKRFLDWKTIKCKSCLLTILLKKIQDNFISSQNFVPQIVCFTQFHFINHYKLYWKFEVRTS